MQIPRMPLLISNFVILFFIAIMITTVCPFANAKNSPLTSQAGMDKSPVINTFNTKAPIIPRKMLFGSPDKTNVAISPDGTKISYLAPVNGILNVWVGPVDNPDTAKPVTSDKLRGIRVYLWAYSNSHIIYIQDKDGDENWHVYVLDLQTGAIKDLTPFQGVQARLERVSPKFPDEILVGLNKRDKKLHDMYRINILTGEMSLAMENPNFATVLTDRDFKVRLGTKVTPDGGYELFRTSNTNHWESFLKIGQEDSLSTYPYDFNKTGEVLYLYDSRNRNTTALYALDFNTGKKTFIAEDSKADITDLMIHPTERTIQAVSSTYELKRWKVLDPSIKKDFRILQNVANGLLYIESRTLDDQQWIVSFAFDNKPTYFYHYDRRNHKAHFLFTNRKELENQPLAKMHPVIIKSRDGLSLICYLSLPPGSNSKCDIVPSAPLPMVLIVHGGPWHRNYWGCQPLHQWLANRGYVALDVNFRGSRGFGKSFINAGDHEWGGKMQNDLLDAVQWAIKRGIADPHRIAIYGGSYGGYAAMVGLTFTPDIFACGVNLSGPSNLVTMLESIPPYWKPQLDLLVSRLADPRTEDGRKFLLSRSPITYIDNIKKPLLMAQGANDPRVKIEKADLDKIIDTMKQKQVPLTYAFYPDEGHGLLRPENLLSWTAVTEDFLAKYLGGRLEPIGDDLKGSSITIQTFP